VVRLPDLESSGAVDQLGRYTLIGELARGGMGVVYLAIAKGVGGFNKLCVVKELRIEVSDPAFVRMFLDEARLAAQLTHPNIVQTYEVGSELDRHFLVMEFLEGQTLSRFLKRARASNIEIDARAALFAIAESLGGLHAAHEQHGYDGRSLDFVHRDVSPQNIFVTYTGIVKVVDFGIAKTRESTHQTAIGTIKGKVAYMAPEQVTGAPVDRRADVFASGCVLFEALTGQRLWGTRTDNEILALLHGGMVPDLLQMDHDLDPTVLYIIRKATAADPRVRYQTALEMQSAIESLAILQIPSRECARLLGEGMQSLFAKERARVRALVEEQLNRLGDRESAHRVPLLRLSEPPQPTPISHSRANIAFSASGARPADRVRDDLLDATKLEQDALSIGHRAQTFKTKAASDPSGTAASGGDKRLLWVAAGGLLLGFCVLFAGIWSFYSAQRDRDRDRDRGPGVQTPAPVVVAQPLLTPPPVALVPPGSPPSASASMTATTAATTKFNPRFVPIPKTTSTAQVHVGQEPDDTDVPLLK
jgi:eukaryotic-like serine/threonine-protein kinase